MLDIKVRPCAEEDIPTFEKWRTEQDACELEVPNGYEGNNVETAVAESADGRTLGSLTVTMIASLDPYIRNPEAGRLESLQSLFALCRALEYRAQRAGCRESYIAIPNKMADYMEIVKRCGFEETAQECKIFRHKL